MKEFDIEEELKKLPHNPGVYLMHDENEGILYVGKAVDLHNRVRQYFRKGHGHNNSPKINKMVTQIAYFEYIITASEMEALVLECNLIKKYRPKYNTMMTDDKGYPYIRVTLEEEYPRLVYSHRMSRGKSQYFGPFTDSRAVRETILLLQKLFRIRNCSKDIRKMQKNHERPCLYYQIGQCSAPCAEKCTREEYMESIRQAIRFLNGDTKETREKLNQKMQQEAAALDFENAAATRDLIKSLDAVMQRQRINDTGTDEDQDIIALARNDRDCVISIFFVRNGDLMGRENHHMSVGTEEMDSEILTAFVKQYYLGTPFVPKEIITAVPVLDSEVLLSYLMKKKEKKVVFLIPRKGKRRDLLNLASDNANLILGQDIERMKRKEARTTGACREIAEMIGIPGVRRMEAYDISHISGYHSVASMVVFENGLPKRNAYRKFRLRGGEGNNDYASMKETLARRFTDDKLGELPDVLMMDGGAGQVNIAEEVLNSLGLDIPVCGMVKDDNHRTRALLYHNREVRFPPGSEAMHMVTALQDETHRFAISYHQLLRSKDQVHSVLDDIEGIGPARRQALLLHFKGPEAIRTASVEELKQVKGMTESAAENVYRFFH